ncbi:hypothetical protein ACNJNU_15465 [Citrobacter freundii]|uniref:hypothetical protein n=1 Tax=Citrobacter freundii TaxID=546 RepID=UPI003A83684E
MVMLKAALCDGMKPDEISRQVHLVVYLVSAWAEILIEAGRIGQQLDNFHSAHAGKDNVVKKPAESHPDSYAYTGSKYREESC